MIFLVLFGKIMFLFLENMILTLDRKWKMIFFQKKKYKEIWYFPQVFRKEGLFKKKKKPRRDMIFLVLSGKMVFFSRKHDIFSLARKPAMTFLKKYMDIWYFLCTSMGVTNLVSRPPAKKKIKDGPIPQKYT